MREKRQQTKKKAQTKRQNQNQNKNINYNYDITFKNCMSFTLYDFKTIHKKKLHVIDIQKKKQRNKTKTNKKITKKIKTKIYYIRLKHNWIAIFCGLKGETPKKNLENVLNLSSANNGMINFFSFVYRWNNEKLKLFCLIFLMKF